MRMVRMAGHDDRGVTALEYVAIIGFLAALVMPAAFLAANALWGSNGAVAPLESPASEIGRGPYPYPDGPVAGSQLNYGLLGGNNSYYYYGLVARNGNLFVEAAARDTAAGVNAPAVSQPYVSGSWNALYIPQTGGTLFMSVAPPGGTPADLPDMRAMGKYPWSSNRWSCGC